LWKAVKRREFAVSDFGEQRASFVLQGNGNSGHTISLFFGGGSVANFVPHFVAGIQGRPFRTPFARLRGRKQSSPTLNVLWAAFNLAMAYELIVRVKSFDLRDLHQAIVAGLGALGASLLLAKDSTGP
jgi:hypothetical protein